MAELKNVIHDLQICIDFAESRAYGGLVDVMRDALTLLKAQEPVEPRYIDGKRNHFIMCGNCNTDLIRGMKYCSYCGRAVEWK